MVELPVGGSREIRFTTDVEDEYFDRVSEPGELRIGLLEKAPSDLGGGDAPGVLTDISTVLNVTKSSPTRGQIRVNLNATDKMKVGDAVTVRAELSQPSDSLEQIFLVKVTDSEKSSPPEDPGDEPDDQLGLPNPVMVYEKSRDNSSINDTITWDNLEEKSITTMNRDTVVFLHVDEDGLNSIYVNMDSGVLMDYRNKLKTEEQISTAEKGYFSSIYFHALFLFSITKKGNFAIRCERDHSDDEANDIEIKDYISELFDNHYASFLLNFNNKQLIETLDS